eukprot:m.259637 g.259637  ORF g.259637 m.259637 type:complete len:205 (+) comp38431_c0_seq1:226-840(+)
MSEEAVKDEIFGQSANLSQAVALINDVDEKKTPKLLQKVLEKLHLQNEKTFSADEEDALADAFEIDTSALTLLLDTISFIFETIAYHQLEPEAVLKHTKAIGLSESQSMLFAKAWNARGATVVENLRNRSFFQKEATDVSWRLNLRLAQSTQAIVKEPNALFEINVQSKDKPAGEKVQMEFTRDELYKFYTQLEIVQQQLDSLN